MHEYKKEQIENNEMQLINHTRTYQHITQAHNIYIYIYIYMYTKQVQVSL